MRLLQKSSSLFFLFSSLLFFYLLFPFKKGIGARKEKMNTRRKMFAMITLSQSTQKIITIHHNISFIHNKDLQNPHRITWSGKCTTSQGVTDLDGWSAWSWTMHFLTEIYRLHGLPCSWTMHFLTETYRSSRITWSGHAHPHRESFGNSSSMGTISSKNYCDTCINTIDHSQGR